LFSKVPTDDTEEEPEDYNQNQCLPDFDSNEYSEDDRSEEYK
jgi:hypothetical protein